jgi:hypothetical protein
MLLCGCQSSFIENDGRIKKYLDQTSIERIIQQPLEVFSRARKTLLSKKTLRNTSHEYKADWLIRNARPMAIELTSRYGADKNHYLIKLSQISPIP